MLQSEFTCSSIEVIHVHVHLCISILWYGGRAEGKQAATHPCRSNVERGQAQVIESVPLSIEPRRAAIERFRAIDNVGDKSRLTLKSELDES